MWSGNAAAHNKWKYIEVCPFGQASVVRSTLSGAAISIDPALAAVVSRLAEGAALDDLAALAAIDFDVSPSDFLDEFAKIERSWQDIGLFDGPHVYDCPGSDIQDSAQTRVGILTNGHRSLLLLCEDAVLSAQLRFVFGRFLTEDAPTSPPTTLTVATSGDLYCVRLDGQPLWEPCGLVEARSFCTRTIAETLTSGLSGVSLHAGAVAGPQGAVAFTGTSGSGKSTLVGNLVSEGYRFVTDDILPIGLSGDCVYSFPVPLAMKQGGGKLPALDAIYQNLLVTQDSPRDGVHYADFSAPEDRITAFPFRALVLPSYVPDAENQFYQLDPRDCLNDILVAGTHFPTGSISSLLKLLENVPIYRLIFRSTQFSLESSKQLLEQVAGPVPC
ncbi:hypothetical protein [Mameliella sediminis]|uniref:hypothetical protein n=1 Tax=Mameliella sediminis TaxID=2836866 RepID=UPI001C474476|nr:hypothetical protein [Mameliella sediminis]MBV7395629.1 hypothetical protein [Mameliella sediminis]